MKKLSLLIILTVFTFVVHALETDKLRFIGMPVGGIGAGQVYLGGDGQLWYWDIFNYQRVNPGENGDKFYLNPLTQDKIFDQGFAIRLNGARTSTVKMLNSSGFSDISFDGQYPIGNVSYADDNFPVSAKLRAFSPFIPGDADASGLPVVVMEYTLQNTSDEEVNVDLFGWLQNMSGFTSRGKGEHVNRIEGGDNSLRLICECEGTDLESLPDYGNMSLTVLGSGKKWASPVAPSDIAYNLPEVRRKTEKIHRVELGNKITGVVGEKMQLKSGEEKTITFLLSYYYPNVHRHESGFNNLNNLEHLRYYYSEKFKSSAEVSDYVESNYDFLVGSTKKWVNTWYDSSLPRWFLDRTFLNVSTLATRACYRVTDLTGEPSNMGRFYAMEGVYRGEGTCTHVYHYEQAMGRVFPHLTRQLREQVDYGIAFLENGIIQYRGPEYASFGMHDGRGYAVDGHAGTILRTYREHLMSPDMSFLNNNWSKIKKSVEYMIAHDKEKTGKADGILEGVQYNTLDRMWYGKITWISGLYTATLKAAAAMATDVGDKKFAQQCNKLFKLSSHNISKELFNGEYFIQKLDEEHLDAPNSNDGCHVDQLLGQYWSMQLGLGNIFPEEQVTKALESMVKYNYVDNYGEYLSNAEIPIIRWYADRDESGTIMCSFPKGGADKAPGKINSSWEKLVVGYFSEMWTGQEHQLAATLIDAGMIDEGLKVEKAVHDRYAAERRNPYNEVEYGNHYTRAMSGYAPFVSASGFVYDGPKGIIGFSPKIDAASFKSAFISAEGWGSFTQSSSINKQTNDLRIKHGKLILKQFNVVLVEGDKVRSVDVYLNDKKISSKVDKDKDSLAVTFSQVEMVAGDKLSVVSNL